MYARIKAAVARAEVERKGVGLFAGYSFPQGGKRGKPGIADDPRRPRIDKELLARHAAGASPYAVPQMRNCCSALRPG